MRHGILGVAIVYSFSIYFSALIVNVQSAPNIIFILADDLGYDDLSYSVSQQINTPNIAKLRSEGRGIEWYYGQPNCSPTRATIQTGRHSIHTGINSVIMGDNYGVGLENLFMSNILHQNGYSTHAIGKWHMGCYKWAYTPTYRGFESFYGYYSGAEDYYNHTSGDFNNSYDFHDEKGLKCGPNCSRLATEAYGTYSAYLFTEKAINIINHHNKTEKPLYLWLAYQSVHTPHEVPAPYENAYNGIIQNSKRRLFAGMVSCLDESIGNITQALQQNGYLDSNTVIVFTSDNGGLQSATPDNTGSSNWPLRGGKKTVWEGGTRLQAFMWTTTDIMSNKSLRGGNYTQLMHISDWWPSLVVGAAGIKMPELNYTLDGVNMWKGLIGEKDTSSDEYFYFRKHIYYDHNIINKVPSNGSAYRKGWNKLINVTGGNASEYPPPPQPLGAVTPLLLYNLSTDPFECTDISKDNQELVQQLYEEMTSIFESAIYYPNPPPDTNCPAHVLPNNSVVGPYLAPWCGEY